MTIIAKALLLAAAIIATDPSAVGEEDIYAPLTEDGIWRYHISEDASSVSINRYRGDDTESVDIPSEINGMPVTCLESDMFLHRLNPKIESVVIPDTVTELQGAFHFCSKLHSVSIPDSVKIIGGETFEDTALTSVEIPDSVTYIGQEAFSISRLESVVIPASVTYIGPLAFWDTPLKSATILNPDCELDCKSNLGNWVFSNAYNSDKFNGILYGYRNSTTQTYAEEHSCHFVPLDPLYAHGDLDWNEVIDANDAAAVLTASALDGAGLDSGLAPEEIAAADLNGDGLYDALDAALILQYSAAAGSGQDVGTIEEFANT